MDKDKVKEYTKKYAESRRITEEEAEKHAMIREYKKYREQEDKSNVPDKG